MTGSIGHWKCEMYAKIISNKKGIAQHKKSHSSGTKFMQ